MGRGHSMSDHFIIAGFHRSATSMVAQLLHRAGLFLGDELLGASPSNPYGHYEDREVIRLHGDILADNGLSWQVDSPLLPVINQTRWQALQRFIERRNIRHKLWGFKDPRVCLFMMVWKYLLPQAKVLIVYRHFSDVTYSLSRRQSSDIFQKKGPQHLHRRFWQEPDLALRMWLVHTKALLAFARTYPEDTLVVSQDMVYGNFPLIRAINNRWGFGLEEIPSNEVLDLTVTERRPGRQPLSDSRLIEHLEATWQTLELLSANTTRTFKELNDGVQ